ncbi:hypothetical protein [Profundibacterium mesophilum]|uniref:Prokaryotic membrane lipoprotein lipid attachment site domain containing protein n=1 Tax=Profundibacterium mesophilum KAUST100406-0324 TaxID=1037889 RepID=A0A921NS38_9RHOB|nr:hypothetical protein [Profundibacterium mesophilum]KAF0675424.1 Prokaryotic membrane lipoprotein lipid attachment site domain containing protein [Profundibacterium mesophilum KAUST100406-0324]
MVSKKIVLFALLGSTLAACTTGYDGRTRLTNDGQRAAIGAVGAGALAAATDNDVGTAVAAGAAAGALCDDVTPGLCPR